MRRRIVKMQGAALLLMPEDYGGEARFEKWIKSINFIATNCST